MFDVLVESTNTKRDKRTGRYFAVTTIIYAVALLGIGVGTIIGFSPALAEEYSLQAMLTPPVPFEPAPPQVTMPTIARAEAQPDVFAPPKEPAKAILLPDDARRISPRVSYPSVAPTGLPPCNGCTARAGIPGGMAGEGDPPPPPPEPKPTPKPEPMPTPQAKSGVNKVSEGVLQGGALSKMTPAYPAIAKAARASGAVQVVVTISEEGRVLEAYPASGHPLLRGTAVAQGHRR